MAGRECPLCGEPMRLKTTEITDRVPDTLQSKTTKTSEWVCPECDYFEEAEEQEKS